MTDDIRPAPQEAARADLDRTDSLKELSGLAAVIGADATVTLPMPVFAVIRDLASESLAARDKLIEHGWAVNPMPQEVAVRSALARTEDPR